MIRRILAKRFALIVLIIIIAGGFVFYNAFLKPKGSAYITEKAVVGTVVKDVSDTGTVRSNDKIELSFKGIGKIEKIYVKNGDIVKAGQDLVRLDISDLNDQLNQAYADLSVSQASEHDSLSNAYANGLSVLNDAYTKIYTAYNAIYELQQSYFLYYSGSAGNIIEYRDAVKSARDQIKAGIDEINSLSGSDQRSAIDRNISKSKSLILSSISAISSALDIVRSGGFKDSVSSTDKALIETQRTNLNTVYSNLSSAEQDISVIIPSKNSGMSSYEAQIAQAQAKIATLKNQINESVLKSPIDGRVVESDKKEGETVQAKEAIVSVISSSFFEVKVNIYEGDIAEVRIGNPVKIELVAFPDMQINGKVVSIDPSERLISEIVYYEVTISMASEPAGIKEGMTADITIESAKKENVLMVPKKGVEKINGERIVQVLKSGKVEDVKVKTGLEGNDYTEIISGLSAGEDVVIGKKI